MNFPVSYFPFEIIAKKDKDAAIAFLQKMPITPGIQKAAFINFCKYVGIVFDHEDLIKLLGPNWERV